MVSLLPLGTVTSSRSFLFSSLNRCHLARDSLTWNRRKTRIKPRVETAIRFTGTKGVLPRKKFASSCIYRVGRDRFNGINSRSKNWYNLARRVPCEPSLISLPPPPLVPLSCCTLVCRQSLPGRASPGPFCASHCICASVPEILILARA